LNPPKNIQGQHTFVIVGVESTGKSMGAQFLANELNAILIPEYARLYLEQHDNHYDHDGFKEIAHGQKNLEDEAVNKAGPNDILVFDTDFIVIYVWSKIVYGSVPQWIIDRIHSYSKRLYFLMTPEVEWVNDGMREYPDPEVRRGIHQIYQKILEDFNMPYHIISGTEYEKRQLNMLKVAKAYLSEESQTLSVSQDDFSVNLP